MPRKKRQFDLSAAMARLRQSGVRLEHQEPSDEEMASLPSLDQRIKLLLNIIDKPQRKSSDMIFFVMYDIEDNRVRRLVVKYLEQKGCHRVQKSIFLADLPAADCHQMQKDLTEVQESYDNNDSILFVPISTEYINSMKIIGKNIDVDLILKRKNILFF